MLNLSQKSYSAPAVRCFSVQAFAVLCNSVGISTLHVEPNITEWEDLD